MRAARAIRYCPEGLRSRKRQSVRARPVLVNVLRVHIGLEAAIHLLGHLPQGQFARSAIRLPRRKKFSASVHLLFPVNISALHAVLERFGSESTITVSVAERASSPAVFRAR